jgi:predicted hydrocarbon binding protein
MSRQVVRKPVSGLVTIGQGRRELAYLLSPGKKTLQIVVKMSDTPGALAGILQALSGHINLIGVDAYGSDDGHAILSCFAEPIARVEGLESLKRLISSSPYALDCKVTESTDGILVDTFHAGIETQHGESLMLFRRDAMNQMFDRMAEIFGSGGEVMLFYERVSTGESNSNDLLDRMGRDVVGRNMPSVIQLLSASGWGEASIVEVDPAGAPLVRIEDCFECSSERQSRHGCAFMGGVLTGSAKAILGTEVRCEETRCRFRGDKHCEFAITR